MSEFSNEAGAEVGGETVTQTNDAGASGGTQSHIPANYDLDGGADAGDVDSGAAGTGAQEVDKPALSPLTVEEYQRRHDNMNAALKETRGKAREAAERLERAERTLEAMKTAQPTAFERYSLEAYMAEAKTIDYNKWAETDRPAAEAAYNAALRAQARLAELDEADKTATQAATREQAQRELTSLGEALQEQETAFKLTHPDYDQAIGFFKAELIKDMNAQGVFGQEAEAAVTRHLIGLGARVHAQGQDLAAFSYQLAERRGWKSTGGGAAPSQAAAKLDTIAAGADAARTISDVGTGGGGGASASFEEQMASIEDPAKAREFWEKAKKNGGRG